MNGKGQDGEEKGAEDEAAGGCGSANGKSSGGEMVEMEKKLHVVAKVTLIDQIVQIL